MFVSFSRARANKCAHNDWTERDYWKERDKAWVAHRLKFARIEVFCWVSESGSASVTDQSQRDQEKDECPTNAARVRNQCLRVPYEKHDDDCGNAENEGPEPFDWATVVFQENLAATNLTNPPF